jgi:hypothetical protein
MWDDQKKEFFEVWVQKSCRSRRWEEMRELPGEP